MIERLLSQARRDKGLTQRALAEAAGVPQSTIARIESGVLSPRVQTLERILRALGLRLVTAPAPRGEGVDRSLIRRMLRLTPEERVRYVAASGEAIAALRTAVSKARR